MLVTMIIKMQSCLTHVKDRLQHVFLLHGKDLHLDIKKSVVLDKKTDLFWKFNETNNVAKYGFNNDPIVYDKYAGRAELFGQNYSLVLKNVQHSDSGDYTAVLSGGQDYMVVQYRLVLKLYALDSVSGSSDSCNLIVTCSTVDSQISSIFTCDAQNCSLVEKGSFKAKTYSSNLVVYLQQSFIICNHSNQVSVEQTKKDIKLYCKEKPVAVCLWAFLLFIAELISAFFLSQVYQIVDFATPNLKAVSQMGFFCFRSLRMLFHLHGELL
uniref:Immunoglobulin subtype domain-containing protein n=1 Tax=Oreochromis aureus TaxID=47969 RepID=A0AAZ1XGF2_OREAU